MLKKFKKIVFAFIIASVFLPCFISFAETQDELKDRYVTRQEWSDWAEIFINNFEQLEYSTANTLYNEIRFHMWARDMKDETDPVVYAKQIEQYTMKKQAIESGQGSNVFPVTFVMNGGMWKAGKQPLMYRKGNEETQLPDEQDVYYSGKAFVGWFDNINQDGGVVTSIPPNINKPTIYYAKWRNLNAGEDPADFEGKIKLTYHLEGGNWAYGYTPTTYYKQEVGMPLANGSQAVKLGYDFDGWYKTSECNPSDKLTSIPDHMSPAITDVYAKWNVASYNVTYVMNGGNWSSFTPTMSRLYTESLTLPTSDKLTYPNHIFIGWYDNSLFYGSKITSIPAYTASNKTYYAKWVNTTYSVTLIENGGSYVGISEPTSREYLSTFTLPTNTQIKKTGYTFDGWYENSSYSGLKVTDIPAETEGDKTFYAKWIENTYTMNYHLDNGTTSASLPATRKYSSSISLPNNDQMSPNSGYKFRGWFADASHTTLITSVAANTEVKDVYAGFEPMNSWSSIDYTSWMSNIPDDMYISEINIPGAHDSGCCNVSAAGDAASFLGDAATEFAKTQAHYVVGSSGTQFEYGVRAFDIRLDDNGYLCHGDDRVVLYTLPVIGDITVNLKFWCKDSSGNKITINNVFDKASQFLHNHPSETVIFLVTNESGSGERSNVRNKVNSAISTYTASYNGRTNYKGVYTGTTIPKLGDVRGKIVILDDGLSLADNNTSSTAVYTKYLDYYYYKGHTKDGVTFVYENHYNKTKEDKWTYVKTALDKCTTKINTQINKESRTAKSGNIWTTSNCADDVDLDNTPNKIDTYIDNMRNGYGWVKGNAYGIVWMDFVREADAKLIIKTNP